MPSRFCASCGGVLPCLNRSKTCRQCKEQDKRIKQQKFHQDRVAAWHKIGHILVHTCLGNVHDKTKLEFCTCRRFVLEEKARQLVAKGLAVDFETRHDYFFNRAILLKKALRTPRSQTIDRTQVETGVQNIHFSSPKFQTAEQIEQTRIDEYKLLQLRLQQERSDKAAERERWDIYNEITCDALRALIVEVPAEKYDAMRAEQIDVPVIWAGIGDDSRTLGGVGRTVFSTQMQDAENELYQEDQDASTDIAEDAETADPESAEEPDTAEDSFADQVGFQIVTEETEEEAA
jgi:hypothetical protein